MKMVVKNILLITITALITGTIVYAFNYTANDITYKDTTVADALDALYEKADYPLKDSITIRNRIQCKSGDKCTADYYLGQTLDIFNNYKYFKVNIVSVTGTGVTNESVGLSVYNMPDRVWEDINFDQGYLIKSENNQEYKATLSMYINGVANELTSFVYDITFYN